MGGKRGETDGKNGVGALWGRRSVEEKVEENRIYLSVALLGEDGALPEIGEPRPPVSCHEHLCRVDVVMDEPRALERVASVQQARAHEHAEGDELEGVGLLELDELVQLRRARVFDQLLERTARSLKKERIRLLTYGRNGVATYGRKWVLGI